MSVAILILVDFPLQYHTKQERLSVIQRRNPYFSGFSLAIEIQSNLDSGEVQSQSLF